MARVRRCPTCGQENGLVVIRCQGCGVSIAQVSPTEALPPEPEISAKSAGVCAHCEAAIPGGQALCPYCGESLSTDPQIVLEWPWGAETLDQPLIVGRDPEASLLGLRLRDYGNLSRRHARLSPAAEGLWIEDLGSTNGVFVDGKRLTPHQPFLLAESGELRLAKDFVMRVRIQKLSIL